MQEEEGHFLQEEIELDKQFLLCHKLLNHGASRANLRRTYTKKIKVSFIWNSNLTRHLIFDLATILLKPVFLWLVGESSVPQILPISLSMSGHLAGHFVLGFSLTPAVVPLTAIVHAGCALSLSCVQLFVDPQTSPPGSSALGIFQARILEWVAFLTPWDLPDPGNKPASLASPELAGGFFLFFFKLITLLILIGG